MCIRECFTRDSSVVLLLRRRRLNKKGRQDTFLYGEQWAVRSEGSFV